MPASFKVKEAMDFIHRFNDSKNTPEPKLVDSARLKGGVLIVITDHDRSMPDLVDDWIERRWTIFVHGRHVASGTITDEDKE